MADDIKFRQHFEDFLNHSEQERIRAEKRRDYRDLKQWSQEQVEVLEARQQAPIVFDYVGKKVDAFLGMENQRRTDPRALPRTMKHEQAAEAITDSLRYVEETTSFDDIASEVFEEKIVEGYGGCIIEVSKSKEDFKIEINQVHWDRIYFDPYSRRKDFKDARYIGITVWMDTAEAKERFGEEYFGEDFSKIQQSDATTFDDRPTTWIDTKRKRVRVNQEYYLDGGTWMEVWYCGDNTLKDPKPSPYLDDSGEPECPIELQSDFVDRDNNRYGYIERLIYPQDEINHRRSKALYLLSSRSVIADQGATNMERWDVLQELRKAQSYIEVTPNSRFEIESNTDFGAAQLQFYQEAKQAMDEIGLNPELSGRTDQAISGRAFIARQQGGQVEVERLYRRHSEWKVRVFRQIWARVKQFWTEEKWIRVTDNENATKWIGLNIQVRAIDKQLEQATGKPLDEIHKQFGTQIEQAIQANPALGQVVEVRNNPAEIDVDILIEEAPDTLTIQQEQFEALAQLYPSNPTPQMFEAMIRMSTIRNKDEILEMLKGDENQQQAQAQEAKSQLDLAKAEKTAQIKETLANTALKEAQAKDEMASAQERVAKIFSMGIERINQQA